MPHQEVKINTVPKTIPPGSARSMQHDIAYHIFVRVTLGLFMLESMKGFTAG